MEDIPKNKKNVIVTKCGHIYDKECLNQWLETTTLAEPKLNLLKSNLYVYLYYLMII